MLTFKVVLLCLLAVSALYLTWGTIYSFWRFKFAPPPRHWLPALPPISILKPLKGMEPGLFGNLQSFAELAYPTYEVILAVSSKDDPAMVAVDKVMGMYPDGPFRLKIGDAAVGLNPKVNNLVPAEAMASHDIVLISDATVRADKDYLRDFVSLLRNERNGIVSATYEGFGARGLGAELEQMHLNTFYARSVKAAHSGGQAFVMGASMMYRRSVAEKFGGLASCGNYLNEDYAMGLLMKFVGRRVNIVRRPVRLYVGNRTAKAFLERHVRWSIIMKKAGLPVFLAQPLQFSLLAAAASAAVLPSVFGLHAAVCAALVMAFWYAADLLVYWAMSGRLPKPHVWILRELLLPFIWLTALLTDTVNWRGAKLRVTAGGTIEPGA